jgi:hypothetical protein
MSRGNNPFGDQPPTYASRATSRAVARAASRAASDDDDEDAPIYSNFDINFDGPPTTQIRTDENRSSSRRSTRQTFDPRDERYSFGRSTVATRLSPDSDAMRSDALYVDAWQELQNLEMPELLRQQAREILNLIRTPPLANGARPLPPPHSESHIYAHSDAHREAWIARHPGTPEEDAWVRSDYGRRNYVHVPGAEMYGPADATSSNDYGSRVSTASTLGPRTDSTVRAQPRPANASRTGATIAFAPGTTTGPRSSITSHPRPSTAQSTVNGNGTGPRTANFLGDDHVSRARAEADAAANARADGPSHARTSTTSHARPSPISHARPAPASRTDSRSRTSTQVPRSEAVGTADPRARQNVRRSSSNRDSSRNSQSNSG